MCCPYCNQGRIMKVFVKKTMEIIHICEECDTVWTANKIVSALSGISFDLYAKERELSPLWSELEILKDSSRI